MTADAGNYVNPKGDPMTDLASHREQTEEDRKDRLYLKLHGAWESLCLAQMLCDDATDRQALSKAMEGIAFVGSQLPNWSPYMMPVPIDERV